MEHPLVRRLRGALLRPRNVAILGAASATASLGAGSAHALLFVAGAGALGWVAAVTRDVLDPRQTFTDPAAAARTRARAVADLERRFAQVLADTQAHRLPLVLSADFVHRRHQLRRIAETERVLLAGERTPGIAPGASSASGLGGLGGLGSIGIGSDVRAVVDEAVELTALRLALLRAFLGTNGSTLRRELEAIRLRHEQASGAIREDLALLVQAKEGQLAGFGRLRDQLIGVEAQLDTIETFLATLSYDPDRVRDPEAMRQQMARLQGKLAARREAVEEIERAVAGLDRHRPMTRAAPRTHLDGRSAQAHAAEQATPQHSTTSEGR